MDEKELQNLFDNPSGEHTIDWCRFRNAEQEEKILRKQSEEFRRFWREKIMDNDVELSEADMDKVILFFDNTARGYGKFKESGGMACAKANLRMTQWYAALRDLKNKQDIKELVNRILTEKDDEVIIDLLDQLERVNRYNGNGLTSAGTIALSAILFTYNPDKYLAMLLFNHRLALIKFFGLGDINSYRTYGEKIVKTKNDIISNFKEKYGIDTTPWRLSFFAYCQLDGKYNWRSGARGVKITHAIGRVGSQSDINELNVTVQRNKIPESVRNAVWRRDRGQCAECGSRENLEFDHIIPVSKGGGNTVRNIELLCENCNRKKSSKI